MKMFPKTEKKPDKNGLLEVLEQKGRHRGKLRKKEKIWPNWVVVVKKC